MIETKTPTAAEIQGKLEASKQSLNRHVAAIREEFAPLAAISGDGRPSEAAATLSLEQKAGIVFGATLTLGVIVGLTRKARARKMSKRKESVVQFYMDHVVDEAARLSARGRNPEAALRKVLRRKQPAMQFQAPEQAQDASFKSEVLSTVMRTAVVLVVESGVEWALANVARMARKKSSDEELP